MYKDRIGHEIKADDMIVNITTGQFRVTRARNNDIQILDDYRFWSLSEIDLKNWVKIIEKEEE